jgi:hypothetical protein
MYLSDTGDTHGEYASAVFLSLNVPLTVNPHLYIRCSPGRFFASAEMKTLLAHIIVTYDLKLEEGKKVPRELNIATARILGNADVLFRKRQK